MSSDTEGFESGEEYGRAVVCEEDHGFHEGSEYVVITWIILFDEMVIDV